MPGINDASTTTLAWWSFCKINPSFFFLIIVVLCQLPASFINAPALTWHNLSFLTNYTIGNMLGAHCSEGYKMKVGKSELRINCSSNGEWVLANSGDKLVTENVILDSCLEIGQQKI